jgi:hypothetical protein
LDLTTNYWQRNWDNGIEEDMEKLNELECRQVKFIYNLKPWQRKTKASQISSPKKCVKNFKHKHSTWM